MSTTTGAGPWPGTSTVPVYFTLQESCEWSVRPGLPQPRTVELSKDAEAPVYR